MSSSSSSSSYCLYLFVSFFLTILIILIHIVPSKWSPHYKSQNSSGQFRTKADSSPIIESLRDDWIDKERN